LSDWRIKIDALVHAVRELGPQERASVGPMQQALLDRFQRIENSVLQLEQLEAAWSRIGSETQTSLRELEGAYAAIVSKILASADSPHPPVAGAPKPGGANRVAQR